MARSTKLERIVTDALATRVTATESGITTIQARDLVDVGDNISTLTNDAQYQTLTQVDTKINELIGAAPGTLNTLGEIATALADDDSAIAALTAVNTTQNNAITAIETVNATQNTAIAALQGTTGRVGVTQNDNFFSNPSLIDFGGDFNLQFPDPGNLNNIQIDLGQNAFNLNRFELDPVEYPYGNLGGAIDLLLRNNAIRRLSVDEQLVLQPSDAARQNLINSTTSSISIFLPAQPYVGLDFEIINHATSTESFTLGSETIAPGTRHAVQWDGTEWVVM